MKENEKEEPETKSKIKLTLPSKKAKQSKTIQDEPELLNLESGITEVIIFHLSNS